MKKLFLIGLGIFALFLFLVSCKTRQVQKSKTDSSLQVDSSAIKKQSRSSIDTSKKSTQVKTVIADSSDNEMDIDTDTGTIKAKLDKDGNFTYTGKAKHITVKSKAGHNQVTNTVVQEVKGKSIQAAKTDSTGYHKKAAAHAEVKNVKSEVSIVKTLEVVAVFMLIIAGLFLFLKYKARGVSAIAGDIKKII